MAKSKDEVHDSMAVALKDALNKQFKSSGYQTAYFIDTEKDNPSNISSWVKTGSDMLDLAISNRPHGGLPVGRIIEITGLEGAGKSLLSAHIVAEVQKMDGLAVYIDTEHAVDQQFFESVGVDFSKMLYVPISGIEDAFGAADTIIANIREGNKDRMVTIVIDSIMGAKTNSEAAGDYDKSGWNTDKAIVLSQAMRKITETISREKILFICTNQLRTKLGVSFGDPWTTSGGKALAFHASVRLRIKGVGKITEKVNGVETVVGMKTLVQVVKNRVGPPHKSINYEIYFDSGIDNYGGWLNVMKAYKLVSQAGAWYTYVTDDGEEIKFQAKTFIDKIMKDEHVKSEVYGKICDNYISTYKETRLVSDSTKLVTNDDELGALADQFDGNIDLNE